MPQPTVSVIIPAYNAAWCIARAIDSVLAQTFSSLELIVVDDGSADETGGVVRHYGDPIRLLTKPNGGMSSARNAGIAAAGGRYLAFLDADDRWLPTKLETQVGLLESSQDIACCCACAILEEPSGKQVGTWNCRAGTRPGLADVFANHSAIAGGASSVVARREAVLAVGGFDETLGGAEDTDLWIRLAARGAFACIEQPLVVVMRQPQSVSRRLDEMREGALAMTRKNRHLLSPGQRGAFWRSVYAGILCDYAKWEYRQRRRQEAIKHLAQALATSPVRRGRLALSLLLAIALNQQL